MKPLQKYQLLFVIVASALISLCISGQAIPTSAESTAGGSAAIDKCIIDVASPQDCSLSKVANERIIWKNSSRSAMYVCFDPKSDPFDGYAFYVRPNDKRKSGKITDNTNPSATPFVYNPSLSPCTVPPAPPIRTNPKIIIGN